MEKKKKKHEQRLAKANDDKPKETGERKEVDET